MAVARQKRLAEWVAGRAPAVVEMVAFKELMQLLAPVSESDLRHLLRSSGAPLHPLVAGVDQDSLHTLRGSLLALADAYENGDVDTRRLVRRIVITAKDHAKLAARNQRVPPEKRQLKAEMAAWMLNWLENPAVFPPWVALRAKALGLG